MNPESLCFPDSGTLDMLPDCSFLDFFIGFGLSYFEFQERNLLKMKILVRFIRTRAKDLLFSSLNSNLKVS